jgi:hypothetical protein
MAKNGKKTGFWYKKCHKNLLRKGVIAWLVAEAVANRSKNDKKF